MGELYNRTAWARVGVVAGQASAAWTGLASAVATDRGPGLNQSDAVQVAAELAVTRDLVAAWGYARIVGFPTPGATVDARQPRYVEAFGLTQINAVGTAMSNAGLDPTFLAGDGPFYAVGGDPWGRQLALALDRILIRIGTAEQGPEEMAHATPGFLPLAIPVWMLVTGAALSIIGSVAAWRYLDPDLRRDGFLVRQAAEDYAARLATFEKTGTMPEPSVTEKGAVDTVQKLAKDRSATDWGWAAAVGGGIAAGTVILGAIAGRAA